jgi:hypothetical protein
MSRDDEHPMEAIPENTGETPANNRTWALPPRVKIISTEGGGRTFEFRNGDDQTKAVRATGTQGCASCNALLIPVLEMVVSRDDPLDHQERAANEALALLHEMAPRDAMEGMLVTQMLAVQQLSMQAARRTRWGTDLNGYNSSANQLNKLNRTFCAQMDTLKKYRSTGEQRVTVEHVNVNEGGQAIVGAVTAPPGGRGRGA